MELAEDYAVVKARKDLVRRAFGSRRGDSIFLHPVEAAYLALKDLVKCNFEEVLEWAKRRVDNFPVLYLVYQDLRDRGHRVRVLGEYLVSKRTYMPVSERERILIPEIARKSDMFDDFALAIVDEESEITYFRVEKVNPKGEQKEEMIKFEGYLLGDRVMTDKKEVFERYFYGSARNGFVYLSLLEAAYLVERGLLRVKDGERILNLDEMIEIARGVEEDFEKRFDVYRDLKERRFVVKTGFKFGSDFRVYTRVEDVDELPHSEYLVAIADDRRMRMSEIVRAVRLAHSVRKRMLFSYLTNRREYLKFEWIRV